MGGKATINARLFSCWALRSRKLTNVQCSVVGLQKNLYPLPGVDIRGRGGLGWAARGGYQGPNKAAAGPPHTETSPVSDGDAMPSVAFVAALGW